LVGFGVGVFVGALVAAFVGVFVGALVAVAGTRVGVLVGVAEALTRKFAEAETRLVAPAWLPLAETFAATIYEFGAAFGTRNDARKLPDEEVVKEASTLPSAAQTSWPLARFGNAEPLAVTEAPGRAADLLSVRRGDAALARPGSTRLAKGAINTATRTKAASSRGQR
jgi:hypothetical protein